jgi:hypothetical protein
MGRVLDFLEAAQTQCYIVRGNWDEKPVYDDLMKRPYQYIQEISNTIVDFQGIKIWGIPHNRTTKKSDMPAQPEPVDIILTHADGTRRMMLFEYQTRLIITGHYDEKVAVIRGRTFVSFSQFPNQYAVIDYSPDTIHIRYLYNERFRILSDPIFYELNVIEGRATWETEDAQKRFVPFTAQMEGLLNLKEQEASLSPEAKQAAIDQLLAVGVPKAQIVEHIPRANQFLPTRKKAKPTL